MPWQACQSERNVEGCKKFINFSSKTTITIYNTKNRLQGKIQKIQEPEPEPWHKTTLKFNQQEHPLLGPKQESELHHLLFCPIPEKILVKLDLLIEEEWQDLDKLT